MNNLTWKKNTGQFSSGETGYRGKVQVFEFFWDACRSKINKENKPYALGCSLAGIKINLGNFETEELCKVKAEKVFLHWLTMLNLKIE